MIFLENSFFFKDFDVGNLNIYFNYHVNLFLDRGNFLF